MAIDLSGDSFNSLSATIAADYVPRPRRAKPAWMNQQASAPATQTDLERQIAEMTTEMTGDDNRAETAETPWRGQLDPFGDV